MAKRQWLDPFARQLLRVTGHLPSHKVKTHLRQLHQNKSIELELKALKEKRSEQNISDFFLVDVNRATASDWRQLPGCSEVMVDLLLKLQRGGVQLSGCNDLFQLLELPKSLAEKWSPHLVFHWYGNSPVIDHSPLVDINCSSLSTLKITLKWPKEKLNRLNHERQKRPFKNLADLQERLTLPPSTIENLIGNVRFGSRPAGPKLPPGC